MWEAHACQRGDEVLLLELIWRGWISKDVAERSCRDIGSFWHEHDVFRGRQTDLAVSPAPKASDSAKENRLACTRRARDQDMVPRRDFDTGLVQSAGAGW